MNTGTRSMNSKHMSIYWPLLCCRVCLDVCMLRLQIYSIRVPCSTHVHHLCTCACLHFSDCSEISTNPSQACARAPAARAATRSRPAAAASVPQVCPHARKHCQRTSKKRLPLTVKPLLCNPKSFSPHKANVRDEGICDISLFCFKRNACPRIYCRTHPTVPARVRFCVHRAARAVLLWQQCRAARALLRRGHARETELYCRLSGAHSRLLVIIRFANRICTAFPRPSVYSENENQTQISRT